ncbi:diaminopimelate epimerase [candidate division KSB1 bacterium]|nr:diaminopimelate epimerase [candidate division KSB1 bacterium]NIR71749.1 diaminopimelate epimerase [candidate division KSB1 bacterium]NIS23479.1 diaminopimelate epimerase [candidate division KSB1 bacterium]NIU24102.1 diaminopimelate epimerase [candidate division KSB1 bacterium]NIU92997.1 diaminopimelate epimerase [candidate division KSB1 bacterium]
MDSNIPFFKFSATGNDFILIDNRENILAGDETDFFRTICQRRTAVGADGVLLIENEAQHDFRMRYFNADGTETACGNGARSSAYFAFHQGFAERRMSFVSDDEVYEAEVDCNSVKLRMPQPQDVRETVGIVDEDVLQEAGFVHIGVPHFVLLGTEIGKLNVDELGRKYRKHARFHPQGTNVNFVKVVSPHQVKLRTFERGVEQETLSCGTGCVASAYLLNLKNQARFPIEVLTQGGELRVYSDDERGELFLEGEVKLVFEGKLILE